MKSCRMALQCSTTVKQEAPPRSVCDCAADAIGETATQPEVTRARWVMRVVRVRTTGAIASCAGRCLLPHNCATLQYCTTRRLHVIPAPTSGMSRRALA